MERLKETVQERKGLGREVEREGWGSQAVEALGEGAEFGCGRERWGACTLWGRSFGFSGGAPSFPQPCCSPPMAHQFAPSAP